MNDPILPASGTPRTDAALIKFEGVFPGTDGFAIAPQWVSAEACRQLEKELQAAQRELAEARANAARYVWLRNNRLAGNNGYRFGHAMGWRPEYYTEDEVDNLIDNCAKEPK